MTAMIINHKVGTTNGFIEVSFDKGKTIYKYSVGKNISQADALTAINMQNLGHSITRFITKHVDGYDKKYQTPVGEGLWK